MLSIVELMMLSTRSEVSACACCGAENSYEIEDNGAAMATEQRLSKAVADPSARLLMNVLPTAAIRRSAIPRKQERYDSFNG